MRDSTRAAEAAVAAHVIGADLANAKNNAPTGPELIFVVGMQRAGLRLVEAILCAHPDVASVGPAGVLHATANTLGSGGFGYLECIDDDDRLDAAAAAHMEAVRRRTGAARVAVEAVPGNIFHLALVNRPVCRRQDRAVPAQSNRYAAFMLLRGFCQRQSLCL